MVQVIEGEGEGEGERERGGGLPCTQAKTSPTKGRGPGIHCLPGLWLTWDTCNSVHADETTPLPASIQHCPQIWQVYHAKKTHTRPSTFFVSGTSDEANSNSLCT